MCRNLRFFSAKSLFPKCQSSQKKGCFQVCTNLYWTSLHHTVLQNTALQHHKLHWNTLLHLTLHITTLQHPTLYYTALHCRSTPQIFPHPKSGHLTKSKVIPYPTKSLHYCTEMHCTELHSTHCTLYCMCQIIPNPSLPYSSPPTEDQYIIQFPVHYQHRTTRSCNK